MSAADCDFGCKGFLLDYNLLGTTKLDVVPIGRLGRSFVGTQLNRLTSVTERQAVNRLLPVTCNPVHLLVQDGAASVTGSGYTLYTGISHRHL